MADCKMHRNVGEEIPGLGKLACPGCFGEVGGIELYTYDGAHVGRLQADRGYRYADPPEWRWTFRPLLIAEKKR
jgi:hypothetical protein